MESKQPSVRGFPSSLRLGQGDVRESKKSSILTSFPILPVAVPEMSALYPCLCARYCSTQAGRRQSGQGQGSDKQKGEGGFLPPQLPSPAAVGWVRPAALSPSDTTWPISRSGKTQDLTSPKFFAVKCLTSAINTHTHTQDGRKQNG